MFTELDVILFGTDAGATGKIPRVLIDDVEVLAGGGTSATNLTVVPITGLSEAAHKITLLDDLELTIQIANLGLALQAEYFVKSVHRVVALSLALARVSAMWPHSQTKAAQCANKL